MIMTDDMRGEGTERSADLAPVIPLFGATDDRAAGRRAVTQEPSTVESAPDWHATWIDDERPGIDSEAAVDAEKRLLKRLRTRSLSIREARAVLAESELDPETSDALIERAERNGYLDDARLAEQLAHAATERKAQGRQMIAQTLSSRGIPREIVDAALDTLPDDEAERALEFARKKASGLGDLGRDVALRRLSGQLARRGYGAVALSAARQALDEVSSPRSRVRFD